MNALTKRSGAVALAAMVLTACSDDDDGFSAEIAEYCNASLAIELAPDPDVDLETASDEEISAAFQAFLAGEMRPLVETIEPLVPDEISSPANALMTTLRTVEETGDVSLFEDPSFDEATAAVNDYDIENCGWGHTDLTAVDYGFDGSLPTRNGIASLDFTNEGDEFHVAIVGRLRTHPDVDRSAEGILATIETEQQLEELFDIVASTDLAPGDSTHAVVNLVPGEYVLFCPVPVGSTGDAPGDGPPHFTQGMAETFEVK